MLKLGKSKKHLHQCAEPAVKLSTVLAVGQSAKQAVRRFTDPAFEQSEIPIVENEPAIWAILNIVLNIIPSLELSITNKKKK